MREVELDQHSFVVLQPWMLDLGLGFRETMAYAIIYGFAREGSSYKASRAYMAKWLKCTTTTVSSIIGKLVDAGLIERHEIDDYGFVRYEYTLADGAASEPSEHRDNQVPTVKNFASPSKKSNEGQSKNLPDPIKKFDGNNIAIDLEDRTSKDKREIRESSPSEDSEKAAKVIDYLNAQTGKRFSRKGKQNIRHVLARLHEGHTVEELEHVVDVKYRDWGNDRRMSAYLRPETLFGPKFEAYLNEEPIVDMSDCPF